MVNIFIITKLVPWEDENLFVYSTTTEVCYLNRRCNES